MLFVKLGLRLGLSGGWRLRRRAVGGRGWWGMVGRVVLMACRTGSLRLRLRGSLFVVKSLFVRLVERVVQLLAVGDWVLVGSERRI